VFFPECAIVRLQHRFVCVLFRL